MSPRTKSECVIAVVARRRTFPVHRPTVFSSSYFRLTPELGALISEIWMHESMQKEGGVFERRSEFQLNDSAEFYFTEVARLSKVDYIPTTDDVLRSRVRTTGIVQSDFTIKSLQFSMSANLHHLNTPFRLKKCRR